MSAADVVIWILVVVLVAVVVLGLGLAGGFEGPAGVLLSPRRMARVRASYEKLGPTPEARERNFHALVEAERRNRMAERDAYWQRRSRREAPP